METPLHAPHNRGATQQGPLLPWVGVGVAVASAPSFAFRRGQYRGKSTQRKRIGVLASLMHPLTMHHIALPFRWLRHPK